MIGALWNSVLYHPILNLLLLLYSFFGSNLGWAIIVLTVIFRVVLFPFMKSQYESSAKLRAIQPQMEKIKKKYMRNQKKIQGEQMKLYKNAGYNPLGCFFSMLLPFPFLVAVYQAIRAFSGDGVEITGIYGWVEHLTGLNADVVVNQNFLGFDLSQSYMPLAQEHGYFALSVLPYAILAILVGISQYYSVKLNQGMMGMPDDSAKKKEDAKKDNKKKDDAPDMSSMMTDMNKSMAFTFPLMTTIISIRLPAAVSLYWMLQSWVPVIMYQAYNKFIKKEKNA